MVTHPLPGSLNGINRTAPIARQIYSLRALGVEVDILPLNGRRKFKYLKAINALQRMSREVDIVHANYGFVGWLARNQIHAPLVVSFMGDDLLGSPDANGKIGLLPRLETLSSKVLARLVDGVIVKSPEMARVLEGIDVNVLPNGVDANLFKPMSRKACREALGWSQDEHYVLFPAEPSEPRKGYALAMETVDLLRTLVPRKVNLISFNNFSARVIPTYMNASDAFVFTSFVEGSPNVIKEAMACDLAGVSVSVGDVAENLINVPGYAVCSRDVRELAVALAKLLGERPQTQGRTAIFNLGLDLNSIAVRLLAIYEDVLATSRGNIPLSPPANIPPETMHS